MLTTVRSFVSALSVPLCLLALAAPPAQAQVPRSLGDLVLGARHRPQLEVEVFGASFTGMPVFSDRPYILWPHADAERLPRMDRNVVQAWLDTAAGALGFEGFRTQYVESWAWRDATVWKYALQHDGLELWLASVQVHFAGGRLAGLVVEVPQPLLGLGEIGSDVPRDGSAVLLAERGPDGYRAVPTPATVTQTATHTITSVGSQRLVAVNTLPAAQHVPQQQFTEWNVPLGTFPDQIELDSKGKIWFSQPLQNWLTRFDPLTGTFTQFSTPGGSLPDGMCVDVQDRVWTGFNGGGGLGRLQNGVHTAFAAPYGGAAMAIPKPTKSGTLWVTDHQANRISEFDPSTTSWLQSLLLPTSGAWVVEGDEDPVSLTWYFTCYSVNRLAIKPVGQPIGETSTLGFGPAFPVVSNGFAYYSLWSSPALGCYDIANDQHTLFTHPLSSEVGGPIGALPDGRIALGTRGAGYIMVFDPSSSTFTPYKIPTTVTSNLKDGLTIAPDGTIWFTETSANKIARLKLF
ncbi:MAG TPA: hypothetical protein VMT18_01590 [Planctomycetota bacterium]|nr:hypothetical protein [Planctomycetota bacterium]